MAVSRRQFVGWVGGGTLASVAWASPRLAGAFPSEKAPSMRASIERALKTVKIPSLQPPFRLSASWYRATVARLQATLRDKGLAGVLCVNHLNHNYLAGYFLTRTERPMFLFIPARGEPSFFHPGLDRDLATSWWIKDHEWYFDFQHAGEYNKVQWKAGKKQDLWLWVAKNLAKRGYGSGKLGLDREATPSLAKKLQKALPEVKWENLEKDLLHMRQVKTAEEVALTQKALDLHDAMLTFARGYILEHGTAATDYDVRIATSEFGTRKLMEVLGPQLDARPHTGVGLGLRFGCRTGPATAYP
ncbi:MAG: aminopeptidase P family N-terminal domain-containing protein, partial [Terriglobia bacterium]